MSISKKSVKKGNDAVASRLADFTGEKETPIAGHNKMSAMQSHDQGPNKMTSSQEQDDVNSGNEMDPNMEELSNSLESAGFRDGRDSGKVNNFCLCLTHSHTMTPFDAPGKQAS